MLFGLHVLNSLTTDDHYAFRHFENTYTLNELFDDMNSKSYRKKAGKGIKSPISRLTTFTTDNNKQFYFDLNLTQRESRDKMLELVDFIKTENSKLFYDESEIIKHLGFYCKLLLDENCTEEIKRNIKTQLEYFNEFTSAKAQGEIAFFINYLNGLYVFEQEFKNQLENILGEKPKMNIALQIKRSKKHIEKIELLEFFYKIGTKLNDATSKPKDMYFSTTRFYENVLNFRRLHKRIVEASNNANAIEM